MDYKLISSQLPNNHCNHLPSSFLSMKNVATIHSKKLSPREKEVAFHLIEGASTNSIAQVLAIKPNTVSTIKKNIFTKLGVDSEVGLYKILKG